MRWERAKIILQFMKGIKINMFNKKLLCALFSGVFATAVQAAPAASTTPARYEDKVSSDFKIGVGIQRLAYGTSGNALNQLHLAMGITERMQLGLGFGIARNFGTAAIGGDVRYDLVKRGQHSLFINGTANYIREGNGTSSENGFAAGVLFGFNYGLTENLHASFAYGVQLQFGLNRPDHVATTNTGDYVGNFGLHWYF